MRLEVGDLVLEGIDHDGVKVYQIESIEGDDILLYYKRSNWSPLRVDKEWIKDLVNTGTNHVVIPVRFWNTPAGKEIYKAKYPVLGELE